MHKRVWEKNSRGKISMYKHKGLNSIPGRRKMKTSCGGWHFCASAVGTWRQAIPETHSLAILAYLVRVRPGRDIVSKNKDNRQMAPEEQDLRLTSVCTALSHNTCTRTHAYTHMYTPTHMCIHIDTHITHIHTRKMVLPLGLLVTLIPRSIK